MRLTDSDEGQTGVVRNILAQFRCGAAGYTPESSTGTSLSPTPVVTDDQNPKHLMTSSKWQQYFRYRNLKIIQTFLFNI